MEKPFLRLVAEHIRNSYKDKTDRLCIVLPGKRGAVFLRRHLAAAFSETFWVPTIIGADELITQLSGLNVPDEPELVCELYGAYKECLGEKAESFESFAKWGQLIIHDFNEIDRYLADSRQLYENLRNIREIENWSLSSEELTLQQQRYLEFMGSIGAIYRSLSERLLSRKLAWPGLSYRVAAENVASEKFSDGFHKILFCGFNALSKSELQIIGALRKKGKAEILWDADKYYLENTDQEAGLFMRTNLKAFPSKEPSFIGDHFKLKKEIRIISVPKQIGQAMVVRRALLDLHQKGVPFDQVAVVLANEKLLMPVLQLLPREVQHINVTMEYPLRLSNVYDLVESLLLIHHNYARQQRRSRNIYHKDLAQLLRQPLLKKYLSEKGAAKNPSDYLEQLTRRNLAFIDWRLAESIFGEDTQLLSPLLQEQSASMVFDQLRAMLDLLLTSGKNSPIEHEQLHTMIRVFNRVSEVMSGYPYFNEIGSIRQLFLQIVSGASVPFVGEPLAGLQLMGVLETRTLDFEHVIFVNVNEGVLPSGKTVNSFIPNDLKRVAGLPLYTEKDAVYAYHFYRLLQRAQTVTITYDSETDTFGKGEKSRFVTQLQLELKRYNPGISISETVAVQEMTGDKNKIPLLVEKDDNAMERITRKAMSNDVYGGLSPSGLLSFKACSLRFYLRYGAQLKETDEVEETAEAGTFGSILHLSLENLYQPLIGQQLNGDLLRSLIPLADATVEESFRSIMQRDDISGKSLLQIEAIKVYVKKLLGQDLRTALALKGKDFIITHLEHELSTPLTLDGNTGQVIFVKGKVDRIDRLSGLTRIIDYKSSVRSSDKFEFTGFEPLFHDPDYDKFLQLFIYAWLAWKAGLAAAHEIRPGIIPFKVFTEEPKTITHGKRQFVFSEKILAEFESELKAFISSIFNRELPFAQTQDRASCEFCAYNIVCNFHP